MIEAPTLSKAWHSVYDKHPEQSYCRFQPALGGSGMTLSFGLAAETLSL
jgi:hypothetical protein